MSLKILTPEQIRRVETESMALQNIGSEALMERAGLVFTEWFLSSFPRTNHVMVICGKGNNGGDGLVVARLLSQKFRTVHVGLVPWEDQGTKDFKLNFSKLDPLQGVEIMQINAPEDIQRLPADWIIVDAILGHGTNRPVSGTLKNLIDAINLLPNRIVSIDLPSGMVAHGQTTGSMIHADEVLSFEFPKLGLLLPENDSAVSKWHIRSIGLSKTASDREDSIYLLTEQADISQLLNTRSTFSHKHQLGHALILAGSHPMCGAGILSASAALRSGAGLVTLMTELSCFASLFAYQPEIMCLSIHDAEETDYSAFKAIGMGPGLSKDVPLDLLSKKWQNQSLVLDAQAIHYFAGRPELISELPENTVFTPHPGELRILLGKQGSYLEQLESSREWATRHQKYIVIKGAYTAIVMPDGMVYFNQTGNPGMATAGSGDVLTGILTGLLAQGYDMSAALKIGVWIHGLSGDLALDKESMESLSSGDLLLYIGKAYQMLRIQTENH